MSSSAKKREEEIEKKKLVKQKQIPAMPESPASTASLNSHYKANALYSPTRIEHIEA